MKKVIGIILLFFVTGIIITACVDSSYENDTEYTCMVTVGNGCIKPDMWDSIFYISDAELRSFELQNGDRAIVRFTISYSASDGFGGATIALNEVRMRVPVAALSDTSSVFKQTYPASLSYFQEYNGYPLWVQKQYLTVGVGYFSADDASFVLTADSVSADTLCFTLYTRYNEGTTERTGFLSYDLSSYMDLNNADFVSKTNALDSLCVKVNTLYQYNDSVTNVAMLVGKYKKQF